MYIDIERLRDDLENECMGAAFGGGFGGAFIEASDIRNASPEELVEIAKSLGVNLSRYEI